MLASGRPTPALAVPYRGPMRDDQIALQLYTVRRLAAVDLVGTLRSVAEAGYRAVELAGLPEVAPADLKKMLDDAVSDPSPHTRGSSACVPTPQPWPAAWASSAARA